MPSIDLKRGRELELERDQFTKQRECWEINLGVNSQKPDDGPDVTPDSGPGNAPVHPVLVESIPHTSGIDSKANPAAAENEKAKDKLHNLQKTLMAEMQQQYQAKQAPSLKRT